MLALPTFSDCLPGPCIVFFPRGAATLDRQATAILDHALRQQDGCGDAKVRLAGHLDRGERPGVDRRRALAVRAYLVRGGIPRARITIVARGAATPRIVRADRAPELENSRVEVTVGPGRD